MRTAILCLCLLGLTMVVSGQDKPVFIGAPAKGAPVFIDDTPPPPSSRLAKWRWVSLSRVAERASLL